jgi:DUF1365 family protein
VTRPLFDAIDNLDSELRELSRLHMAFEDIAFNDTDDTIAAGAELSAAVGKFLVTRGYEGRI